MVSTVFAQGAQIEAAVSLCFYGNGFILVYDTFSGVCRNTGFVCDAEFNCIGVVSICGGDNRSNGNLTSLFGKGKFVCQKRNFADRHIVGSATFGFGKRDGFV